MNYLATVKKNLHAQAAGGKAEELPGKCDRDSEDHSLLAQLSGRMGEQEGGNNDTSNRMA